MGRYSAPPTVRGLLLVALATCGCRPADRYARFTVGTPSAVGRVESAAAVVGGELYLFSGFLPGNKATRSIEAFDYRANRWRRVGEMPEGLTHANAAVVDDEVVWLAGGFKGDHPGPTTDEVWRYDADAGKWLRGPSLPAPRGGGALVRLGRRLHYFGGFAEDRQTSPGDHWLLELDGGTTWKPAAPLPEPRGQLGGVAVGGFIYAIGGQFGHDSSPEDVDRVHRYDPATDAWTKVASLPYPRSHFEPGTFVWNGRIVIVGGRNNRKRRIVTEVTMYDPVPDVWLALPPLAKGLLAPASAVLGGQVVVTNGSIDNAPTPQTTTSIIDLEGKWEQWPKLPMPLGEVAGGIVGDRLFIIGEPSTPDGETDSARASPTLAYDLSRGIWDEPSGRAPRPFPDSHHAAEVWDGKLYLFGGVGSAAGKTQTYDPQADTWAIGPDLPFAAGSSASALIDGRIFVAGGIVGNRETTGRVAMFDPTTGRWTERAPMPLPRNHAASGTDGRRFYVFGGRGPGSGDANVVANGFADVQIYDPATDTWTTSSDSSSGVPPLPQARGGMGKAAYVDGEFYVLGGETKDGDGAVSGGVYARVDVYDPVMRRWRAGPEMPVARHGIFPLAIAGRIYLAGGGTRAGGSQSDVLDVLNAEIR
jgi:N-acetylneuraminic acid mutarotase